MKLIHLPKNGSFRKTFVFRIANSLHSETPKIALISRSFWGGFVFFNLSENYEKLTRVRILWTLARTELTSKVCRLPLTNHKTDIRRSSWLHARICPPSPPLTSCSIQNENSFILLIIRYLLIHYHLSPPFSSVYKIWRRYLHSFQYEFDQFLNNIRFNVRRGGGDKAT